MISIADVSSLQCHGLKISYDVTDDLHRPQSQKHKAVYD